MMRKTLTALAASALLTTALSTLSAPPASAASGWETVTSWAGGHAKVCAAPAGNGMSTIHAYWDGRKYPTISGQFVASGAAGLAHVGGDFTISGWTYSHGDKGTVGPTVSLQQPSNGWVYVLSGSQVGITVEAVVPVRTLSACPGAGRVATPVTARPAAPAVDGRAKARCVSRKEFRRIDKGMTPGAVKRTVKAPGAVVTDAQFSSVRRYARCGGGSVVVNYQRAAEGKPLKVDSRFKG